MRRQRREGGHVAAFEGRILVIGLGSVSRCTLPLLFEHIPAERSQYTVLDFGDVEEHARWVTSAARGSRATASSGTPTARRSAGTSGRAT